MEAVTEKSAKKRSRFIVSVIGVCILLLAGAVLLWRNCFSTPDVTIRCGSTGVVRHMTPEDARAIRSLLEKRDMRLTWVSIRIGDCGCRDFSVSYDDQIFGFSHLDSKSASVIYQTVDSDGKTHYVTSYYFINKPIDNDPFGDLAFFRSLIQKYSRKGADTKKASVSTTP